MTIDERKRKIALCETRVKDALRKLTIANTVVRRWQLRLRTQERALMKELEARAAAPMLESGCERRFRNS